MQFKIRKNNRIIRIIKAKRMMTGEDAATPVYGLQNIV